MPGVTSVILAVTMIVGQAERNSTPSAAHSNPLQEYGSMVVGEWEATITLDSPLPGIGKAGDKVVATASNRWIWNNAAVEMDFEMGGLKAKWIAVLEPRTNEIRTAGVMSDGSTATSVITKQRDKWINKETGLTAEGHKRSAVVTETTADGGSTRYLDYSNVVQGGKNLPETRDVYRRKSK